MTDDALLSMADLARILRLDDGAHRCPADAARQFVRRCGRLPTYRIGRRLYVRADDWRAFVEACREGHRS